MIKIEKRFIRGKELFEIKCNPWQDGIEEIGRGNTPNGFEWFIRITERGLGLFYSSLNEVTNEIVKPEINFLPIDTGD